MKILKKRCFAMISDSFLLGFIIAGLQLYLKDSIDSEIILILMLIPFFCRDFVFRNASLGKVLFGIAIYDKHWKRPTFKTLFIRSVAVSSVGYVLLWKSIFVNGEFISIFDFERDRIGTQVIDKKIYRKLQEEAKTMSGDYADNMTRLYNAYLRDIYLKK